MYEVSPQDIAVPCNPAVPAKMCDTVKHRYNEVGTIGNSLRYIEISLYKIRPFMLISAVPDQFFLHGKWPQNFSNYRSIENSKFERENN